MDLALPAGVLPPSLVDFARKPEDKKQAIQKIRYSHDSMIDQIIANPWVSQGELAKIYGYTEGWVSQVISSDAFQGRLAERKADIIDPTLRLSVEEGFKAMAQTSLRLLLNRLNSPDHKISDETALRAAEISAKALGMGAKGAGVQINNSFVVAVPQKAASSEDWARQNGAGGSSVSTPPAGRTFDGESVAAAVLVDSTSSAPAINTKELLQSLKGAA